MQEEEEKRVLPAKLPGRVKTPTLIQMEAVECGAAALGIIQRHYGLWLPLERLRVECGVSRDGSRADRILKAARNCGMTAKGYRRDLSKLYEMNMPVILFWNFNHFLVLEGFNREKVFINDPATGPRVIDHDELDGCYTGVVLDIEPGDNFEKGGERPNMLAALKRRIAPHRAAMWFVLLCGVLLVVPGLVVPAFSRFFIDEILVGENRDWVTPLIIAMGVGVIIQGSLVYLQQYYLLRFETKLALSSSVKFFMHVARLPIEFFAQRYAGEIGSRVQLNDKVANVIAEKMITAVIDLGMICFYAMMMLLYSIPMTLILLALAALNLGVIRYFGKLRSDATRRLLQEEGKLKGTGMSGLQMIETLKATGGEGEFFGRWAGYQAKSLQAKAQLSSLSQIATAVPTAIDAISSAVMLGVGGYLIMQGIPTTLGSTMTMGVLVAYQGLFRSFSRPIKNFVTFGNTLRELEGDMSRLDDVFRYEVAPSYTREPKQPAEWNDKLKLAGQIEFKNVTFGYSRLDPPIIEDFNLTITPGQRVALVGGSGSGKSTIAKLLSGMYEPFSGEIQLDGVDRRDIAPRLINNSMGVIDQDVFMFEGSIRENLVMWDLSVDEKAVILACRDAAIEEIVVGRTGAYDGVVLEGGSNFSGGQRQRLEIARSLVFDPSILIMDEATSALDPIAEKHIDSAVRRRGCTCVIVAHRLSTVRDSDVIVVMERGKIVEMGRHEELLLSGGVYSNLIKE